MRWMGPDLQDGGKLRHGDQLPPHKYIRNTSTCGTTPTEHILNAGRRPQTSQKARNSTRTRVGQKKKQRQKNRDETSTTGRELWRRKSFHTLRSPFTGRDRGWVAAGEASEPWWRAQQQGCRGQSGEIPAWRIGADQHSQPERLVCSPARAGGGWELRLGLRRSDPRERTGVGSMNTAWRGLVRHS